eukprot:PITA_13273
MHNSIPYIQNQGGAKIEKHEEIEEEFLNHFAQVHREPEGDKCPAIERITNNVPRLIMEENNELHLLSILSQEVDEAMSQLKEGKSPGPDAFTTTFFHTFWELIKQEVWKIVEESRDIRWLLPSLNTTFIALIPKEEDSITPDKYRSIALCNVIYKVISKVIANRLKPLFPLLISPEQSVYVEGRQIMDGILLMHEIIHSLKHTKQAGMLLKLDLSTAFDKLSLTYIQKMLTAFGFFSMWVRWIMSLITSTQFSILVNGIPSRPFKPSRGISAEVGFKKIRNLQRGFLWGSSATNHKWALVKWATVCTPKDKGGIGLRDPKHSNSIMSAKIWWQCVTNPEKPWVKLWTAKYANNRPPEELIRQEQQQEKIQQYWMQETQHGFRQWKQGNQLIYNTNLQDAEQLEMELRKRNISYDKGNDILRWGYQPKGTFTPSEAYKIVSNISTPSDPIWRKIWELDSWPKVSYFLWLEDLPSLHNEKSILDNWQLHLPQELQKNGPAKSSNIKKGKWNAPPKHSYKLNFDGASKGNPGIAGFGGILRNHEGTPMQIYFGNIGWDTNNSAELEVL